MDPTGLNSQCPSYTYQDYLQAVQNQIREEENEDAEMCSWNPYHEPDDEEPDPTGGVSEQDWNDVEGEYGLHLCSLVATYNESATLRELAKFEQDHPGVLEQIIAAGVSSIPIVGDIYDFLSGLFGVDLITGETLRGAERLLQLAGILPGVTGSALRRTTNFVGDVAKGGGRTGYRAVSDAELADIHQHGFRPHPGGKSMEDKWFADTRAGAEQHRQNFPSNRNIVEAEVPSDVPVHVDPNIDGFGGFSVSPVDQPRIRPVGTGN